MNRCDHEGTPEYDSAASNMNVTKLIAVEMRDHAPSNMVTALIRAITQSAVITASAGSRSPNNIHTPTPR